MALTGKLNKVISNFGLRITENAEITSLCCVRLWRTRAMTLLRRPIHRRISRHTHFSNQIADLKKNGNRDKRPDYNDKQQEY